MNRQPLSGRARGRLQLGQPLPFGVSDAGGQLLLGSGRMIESQDQLEALLERGAFVQKGDLRSRAQDRAAIVRRASPPELPGLWTDGIQEATRLLRASTAVEFAASLERASSTILALIERDPDLAVFQIVRPDSLAGVAGYASRHSVHASIAVYMAATLLAWDAVTVQCAFRAALTMNIAMVELQNTLATQTTPVTKAQREAIQAHPQRSVELLQASGVRDVRWLQAVAQHHETQDGTGYPTGRRDVDPVAALVQRADVFTAKFSPRHGRASMHSDNAARRQYQSDQGNPMSAALIKAFGLYPPGTTVRLKSGECGVVVRRGEGATATTTVTLTDALGNVMGRPHCRDTSQPDHAITAAIPAASLKVRASQELLMAAARG